MTLFNEGGLFSEITSAGGGGGTSDVTKAYVDKQDKALGVKITNNSNKIQDLEIDKLGVTRYVLPSDLVAQSDALEILSNPTMYEGQIIEFLTNGDLPNKTVALGFVMSEKTGDTYLLTYGLDGTTTQWNRDYHEKHHVETYSFINEIVDMDSFTIDVRGDAPYFASVQNAHNKPEGSGNFGMVFIFAYSIDKQLQIYRDIETGLCWTRTVTGLADHHSFGTWQTAGVTKDYVDTEVGKRAPLPSIVENLTITNPTLAVVRPSTVYKYGTINSLTVTSIPNSALGVTFIFTAGSAKPTINLPSSLETINFVEFEASKKYVIAVENNIAVMGKIGE